MKKVLYWCFGPRCLMDREQQRQADEFAKMLHLGLRESYEFVGCVHSRDCFGLVWDPSIPCDGLVLVTFFPPPERVRYEIMEARSPRNRRSRPVPVISISGRHPSPGPFTDYSPICIGVKREFYQHRDVVMGDYAGAVALAADFMGRWPITD